MAESITINPIGVIHSSLRESKGAPIQPVYAKGNDGVVEIFEPYRQALKDLEGFERIWLIYWFNKARQTKLLVKPYMDTAERGLFATRAPCRPNPIGLSAVRLLRIEEGRIYVTDVDILDGTPLLDIKPYISRFDRYDVQRNGWVDQMPEKQWIADDRFQDSDKIGD